MIDAVGYSLRASAKLRLLDQRACKVSGRFCVDRKLRDLERRYGGALR
jgi:hypothetical protein